jgi:hypothetical protein
MGLAGFLFGRFNNNNETVRREINDRLMVGKRHAALAITSLTAL